MNTKRLSLLLLVTLFLTAMLVPAQAQEGTTIPAANCASPGDLTLRVWDENWAKVLEDATAAWVETYCPGANVTVNLVPWGSYWDLLRTDASSGDLPDVFNMSQDQVGFYLENGALLDLQSYLDAAGIDPTVWGTGLVDPYRDSASGDVYGTPLEWVTVGLYYNKDLFDAAGVEYPNPDWTWDDFAEAARALTDPENGVYGAAVYAEYQAGFGNWIASTGTPPVATVGRTECTFDDPGSIEALSFLRGLLDEGVMPTVSQAGGSGADDFWNLFASGKIAMVSNGAWKLPSALGIAEGSTPLSFNWDVTQLPKNPTTGESRAILHAVSWVASANSANADLAANLIQYLVSDEGQQFFADAGGVAPANPNPGLQQSWIDSFGDTGVNVQAFIDATRTSQGVTTFGDAGDASTDLIVNIFDLGVPVEEAAAQACAEIEPFLNPAS